MKFTSNDKAVYEGATAADVVRDMRAQSFENPRMELTAFMRRTAATASAWVKAPVRADTPENFLADLQAVGVLFSEERQPAPGTADMEQV